MGNHMVDAYVRRDPNAKNHYDSLGSSDEDSLVLPDGILMSSKAFKNSVPQTQYTLAELGIDMAASPYVEALTYEDSDTSDVIVTPREVHHHAEDLVNQSPVQVKTSSVISSVNDTVKEYWGLLVLVGVAVGAGYFIGRRG